MLGLRPVTMASQNSEPCITHQWEHNLWRFAKSRPRFWGASSCSHRQLVLLMGASNPAPCSPPPQPQDHIKARCRNLEARWYKANTRSDTTISLAAASELSLAAIFTGLPAHTSFCLVPLSPRRRTRSVPWSIPIPAVSSQSVFASLWNRTETSRSTRVFIVIPHAAARNVEP